MISRGDAASVEDLFSLEELQELLAQADPRVSVRASFDRISGPSGVGRHTPIAAADASDYWERGASVCIDPIDVASSRMRRFAEQARDRIGHLGAVSVKCYLSPLGAGFNQHFDAHVTTAIQLAGTKRWRYSATPAVEAPAGNAFVDDQGEVRYNDRTPSSLDEWERVEATSTPLAHEVELRPGDVLCLPPGTWHEAKATSECSFALNLAFAPATVGDALDHALGHVGELSRRPLVPAPTGADGTVDFSALRSEISELLAALDRAVQDDDVLRALANRARSGELTRAAGAVSAVTARSDRTHGLAHAGSEDPSGFSGELSCIVPVNDLGAAVNWYVEVLGCHPVSEIAEFGWAELSTPVPGVHLGLSESAAEAGNAATVLNFGVADIAATRTRLESAGVIFEGAAGEIDGVVRFAGLCDPFGNQLMIHQELTSKQGDNP